VSACAACLATCLLLIFPGSAGSLLAAEPVAAQSLGSQVKAVFLFNFTQFVEWPLQSFAGPQAPLVIGVLGEDPFGTYLDDALTGELARGRPIALERYRSVEQVGPCHVLFVSHSEAPRLEPILAQLNGRGVLTVSDLEGFATRGGIIQFTTVQGKIRLIINLAAARRAGLTISSNLLRPAQIVGS
jgi:YfiR/HmsC-like